MNILFRGFHPCEGGNCTIVVDGKEYRGKWVEGSLIGSDVIVGDIVDFTDEYFNTEWWYKVIPETVGQYRFDDCGGEKVFDSDIVDDTFGNKGVVRYSDHFHDLRIRFYYGASRLVENEKWGTEIFSWLYPENQLLKIGTIYDKELTNG